jgi:Flp pilus assembly protein TadG
MGVPLLLVLTLALVWLLSLGLAQARMLDATREAARAVARGDSGEQALAVAREVAPSGATLSVSNADGQVRVAGSVEVDGIAGVLGMLPSVRLTAQAVAFVETPP